MRESGTILKSDENGIEISMDSDYACSGCNACFIDKNKRHVLRVKQDIMVKPGELVEVEVQPGFAIKSAILLFFLPLIMLVLGYYFFKDVLPPEILAMPYRGILGAFLGISLSFLGVYFYDKHLQHKGQDAQVKIVKIVSKI